MDENLKIRVDVNNATLKEMGAALREVRTEMQGAAQSELPKLNAESQAIQTRIKELSGRFGSFGASVKDARAETRVFRFAVLEMVHGLDGIGTAFGVLSGGSASLKSSIKEVTGGLQEALGAGIGLKFGIQALGSTFAAFAGPIGLAVGALVLITSIMGKSKEANEASQEALDKSTTKYIELAHALKLVNDAEYLNNLQAEISINKAKEATIEAELHQRSIGNFFDYMIGKNTQKETLSRLEAAKAATLESTKTYEDSKKKVEKAGEDELTKQYEFMTKGMAGDEAVTKFKEEQLKEQEANYKRFLEDQQHDYDVAAEFTTEDRKLAAENYKRFLADQKQDFEASEGTTGRVLTVEERIGKWSVGLNVLQQGFSALESGIGQGLASAFGQATSLFQMFVQGVIQGLAQIAAQIAESALISLLLSFLGLGSFGSFFSSLTGGLFESHARGGVVNEPIAGVGASGKLYSFGEQGPERISPLTSYASQAASNHVHVTGESRIAGRDILISWKESRNIDRKSGGNL